MSFLLYLECLISLELRHVGTRQWTGNKLRYTYFFTGSFFTGRAAYKQHERTDLTNIHLLPKIRTPSFSNSRSANGSTSKQVKLIQVSCSRKPILSEVQLIHKRMGGSALTLKNDPYFHAILIASNVILALVRNNIDFTPIKVYFVVLK